MVDKLRFGIDFDITFGAEIKLKILKSRDNPGIGKIQIPNLTGFHFRFGFHHFFGFCWVVHPGVFDEIAFLRMLGAAFWATKEQVVVEILGIPGVKLFFRFVSLHFVECLQIDTFTQATLQVTVEK